MEVSGKQSHVVWLQQGGRDGLVVRVRFVVAPQGVMDGVGPRQYYLKRGKTHLFVDVTRGSPGLCSRNLNTEARDKRERVCSESKLYFHMHHQPAQHRRARFSTNVPEHSNYW